MGDWCQWIADVDAEPEKAAEFGARLTDWLVQQGIIEREQTDCVLGAEAGHPPGPNYGRAVVEADDEVIDVWSNGLSVHVGRRAYVNSYVHSIRCPGCAAGAEADDETEEFPKRNGSHWSRPFSPGSTVRGRLRERAHDVGNPPRFPTGASTRRTLSRTSGWRCGTGPSCRRHSSPNCPNSSAGTGWSWARGSCDPCLTEH